VLVAIVAIDRHTGKPIGRPDVISRGFPETELTDGLMERARDVIVESLQGAEHVADRADFSQRVHNALQRFVYDETRRRPMILPVAPRSNPMTLKTRPKPSRRAGGYRSSTRRRAPGSTTAHAVAPHSQSSAASSQPSSGRSPAPR
jgi:hypothetical protein